VSRAATIVIASCLLLSSPTPAQNSAVVDVPNVIKAGETLTFTIRLDRAPSIDGGEVSFTLAGPDVDISTSCGPLKAGQTECKETFTIPASATGGSWHIHLNSFYTGTQQLPIKSTDTPFEVVANKNLVFPTSAVVQINPSQVQLFRTAAARLQRQVQSLKATFAENEHGVFAAFERTTRQNIQEAIDSLGATQRSFQQLSVSPSQEAAEQVFFDDLRTGYKSVLSALDNGQLRSGLYHTSKAAALVTVAQNDSLDFRHTMVTHTALRPFEQNELAYTIAADTASLTFNLTVTSNPPEAAICYHRHGDPCHQNPDPTNTVIESLPYAIWIIQFKKPGYHTEEREHDPFREPNHVVSVDLHH
jgi:hypothetical protein